MFEAFFGPTVPARRAYAITPDDDADVARVTRGVICGGAGNLNCILADDTSAVVIPVLAGIVYPLQVKRVLSTSTTATSIVGLG